MGNRIQDGKIIVFEINNACLTLIGGVANCDYVTGGQEANMAITLLNKHTATLHAPQQLQQQEPSRRLPRVDRLV